MSDTPKPEISLLECYRCKSPMPPLTFDEQLDLHQLYREQHPDCWRDETPVRVCESCWQEIESEHEEYYDEN